MDSLSLSVLCKTIDSSAMASLVFLCASLPLVLAESTTVAHPTRHLGSTIAGTYSTADDDFVVSTGSCTASVCEVNAGCYNGYNDYGYNVWTCAVMGSSSGKAVSGCSVSGTPKSGFTPDSTTTSSTATPTGLPASCPYDGEVVGRLDSGSSNPNYGTAETALAMEQACDERYGAGYFTFLSVGGDDYKSGTVNVACHNPTDDETVRVYFACCNSDCVCKDPVVSGGTSTFAIAADTVAGSTGAEVAVAAVVAGILVAALAVVALVAVRQRYTNSNRQADQLRVALQDDAAMEL